MSGPATPIDFPGCPDGAPIVTVPISQSAAGTTAIAAAQTGKVLRLHEILGALDADGSWQIASGATPITGAVPATAKIEVAIPYRESPNGTYNTAAGAALNLITATGKFFGVAKYSVQPD